MNLSNVMHFLIHLHHIGTCASVVLLVLILSTDVSSANQVIISGTVRDAETGDGIPSASVRVIGSTRGTICNGEGEYRLTLDQASARLAASSLGYAPDTLDVEPAVRRTFDFSLKPSEIVLPEVVVTGEDPAYEIVRLAIANKKRWMNRLHSYEMEAFTRQVLRRDTSIASITEAFTHGYWREGDTLREVTTGRRQTRNIEESFNFASVGRLLNFYEEEVRFIGYSFVGPIADDAFDHYRYRLLRTRSSGSRDLYEIEIIPLSATVPRFTGTISIESGSYALAGVDVQPNEAFLLPFIRDKSLRYRQQFSLFDQTFWLPADIRIDARFSIGVPGFSFPVIAFSQTSVISEYRINGPVPDSVFQKPRLVVDSAAVADSVQWNVNDVLPLTAEEDSAYRTLDSTQTLDVQFRPGGIAMTIGAGSEVGETLLRYLDLEFNRVEGFHLGVDATIEDLFDMFELRGGFAYGFSDKKNKYHGGLSFFPGRKETWEIGGDFVKAISVIPEQGYFGKEINSLTSLFVRNDYRDYYAGEGWKGFVIFSPVPFFSLGLTYRNETHTSVSVVTDFGLFGPKDRYRPNPEILEGRYESLQFDLRLGRKPVPFDLVTRDALDLSVEFNDDFVVYRGVGTLDIPTFAKRFLSQPGFRIRLAAGTYSRGLPRQRIFSLESASSGLGPFGVMRGMRVKEFLGTEYVALNIEHNFRSLPFLALGIPFLYENNIELIVHGGLAQSWNSLPMPLPTTNGWYSEIGFGIARIFELLRVDFTWRLSSPTLFHFTLAAANLL